MFNIYRAWLHCSNYLTHPMVLKWLYQKKGIRKITVDNFIYGWSTTGNDGYINLTIIPLENEGQLLTASFGYNSQKVGETRLADGTCISHWKQKTIITPGIVKQVIEYGLKEGWNPRQKQKQLDLGSVDNIVNLNLE